MRRFFDLLKTFAALSKNLALTGLSAITAILVSAGVFTTLRSDFVIVEPLRVPDKFEKMGISGEVATQHLIDEIAALNASTTAAKERTRFGDKIVAENLSGNVGLIDIKSIQVAMRELLGRQVVRISGEIIARDNPLENKYSIRLRRTPERALLVKIDAEGVPAEVLKQAAFAVMEVIEPHIMAAISYRRGNIERANELIDVVLNNSDPADDKFSLNLRSIMLREEGRLAEALGQANELIKKEPGFWAVWGNAAAIYAAMGDFPQAIRYIDQTIKLAPHNWGPANEKVEFCSNSKSTMRRLSGLRKQGNWTQNEFNPTIWQVRR